MATPVLTLIQDFCEKMSLPRPAAMVGSSEKSIMQYRSILRETLSDLLEYSWQTQRLRKTWTSLLGQDQGLLTTIFGDGYFGLVPGSMWNESRHMQIFGPLPDQTWEALQTLPNAGPEFQSWISGGRLYISPAQVAGETLGCIYMTKYGVLASDGTTTKERVTDDTDTLLFPDNAILRGFEYKWRKQKGISGWEDDYNAFEALIARNIVKDGAPVLYMAPQNVFPRPGIVIPAGSWNV